MANLQFAIPMFFSPRIRTKALANLCRRFAISTSAGIQDRKIWRDEAGRSRGTQQAVLEQVSDSLSRGESVTDALAKTGDFLPRMFKQIVAIGDTSGQLDRSYKRLAEHYEQSLASQRALRSALAWPVIQLLIAVAVIGAVIWITATLNLQGMDGQPLDMFGFGLVGMKGLAIYISLVTLAAICLLLFIQAARRDMLWTRRLERLALRIPMIGGALQTLALARFTWALQLVLDTPMDLRKSLPLALDATGNDYYRELGPQVAGNIQHGMSLHMALADTGAFPSDLLDAIAVGEESGMLAETMQRQSTEFQRRAAAAISILGQAIGYIVWAVVAIFIIMLIYRVFSGYVGTINDLSRPNAF